MTNLMHKFLIHFLQSSTCTCFEQYLAHPQVIINAASDIITLKTSEMSKIVFRVTMPDAVLIQGVQPKSGPLTKPRIFHIRCYL
jgi:hypothetical protein